MLTTQLLLAMTIPNRPVDSSMGYPLDTQIDAPTSSQVAPRSAALETLRQAVASSRRLRASGGTGLAQLVDGGRRASERLVDLCLAAALDRLVEAVRGRAVSDPDAAAK